MTHLLVFFSLFNFLISNSEVASQITSRNSSNYILKLELHKDQLSLYKTVLDKHNSDIDEIIPPRHLFNNHTHSNFNAKWFLYDANLDGIESTLRNMSIAYEKIEQNLDTKFNVFKSLKSINKRQSGTVKLTSGNIVSDYYSLQQIYDWFSELRAKYPRVLSIESIGKTTQNRDILVLKIGRENKNITKKFFWFDFAIHSREWTTIASSMYMIKNILEEQELPGSVMQNFLNLIDIHILAVGNPDGYVYSRTTSNMWRKNMRGYSPNNKCFGVDLNRNFDFDWKNPTGSSSKICNQDYAGEAPSSEPETSAIEKYVIERIPRWVSFISVHSFGAYWIFNRDGDKFPRKVDFISMCEKAIIATKKIKETSNYEYSFGTPVSLLGYAVSGALDTWAQIRTRAKYAFSVELAPNDSDKEMLIQNFGFWVKRKDIEFVAKGFYSGIHEYFRSFIEPRNPDEREKIASQCADYYEKLILKL